jgi:hypothetical protein
VSRKANTVLPVNFSEARRIFKTARVPEHGKPMGKDRRLLRLDERGESYGIKHYSTTVITFYADEMIQIYLNGHDTLSTVKLVNDVLQYIFFKWDGWVALRNTIYHVDGVYALHPMLIFDPYQRVRVHINPNRMWDGQAMECDEDTGKWYKMHPLVRAPPIRPVAKSRNFRVKPIAGDVFTYQGQSYIWTKNSDSDLRAWPYHGDSHRSGFRVVRGDDQPLSWDLSIPEYALLYGMADIERGQRYVLPKEEIP